MTQVKINERKNKTAVVTMTLSEQEFQTLRVIADKEQVAIDVLIEQIFNNELLNMKSDVQNFLMNYYLNNGVSHQNPNDTIKTQNELSSHQKMEMRS
ncbi:MAG: hypothetical protein ACRC17_03105 [Culicoidibacterales bacterium]